MKISVIGTGYVGLVSGTCLADVGNEVICVDNDRIKIDNLRQGILPIYEPGLEDLVRSNVGAGRLVFTSDLSQAISESEIIFIAVGTPPDEDGSADLTHVLGVAKEIGQELTEFKVVVTKSTVPVGTAERVREYLSSSLKERGIDAEFAVASNPEFLKEGAAVEDFLKPNRIVVGADDERALKLLRQLYEPFNRNHNRLIIMDIPSAELTKYAANAMLATKISFMNEIANLAERLGADIEAVRQGIGSDPRIGHHFIYPGCGYGGSCFPKDVQALYRTAGQVGFDAKLLSAVEEVNSNQKQLLLEKMDHHYEGDLKGKKIAIWGLAFKPNTDDMREASSRVIMEGLWKRGASVVVFDPVAMEECKRIYGDRTDLSYGSDPCSTLKGVDGLVVVTEWKVFRSQEPQKMRNRMREGVIFDGRNIFVPERVQEAGFTYYGIGR
ncbi:MAG: UDP-glucose/GDP-mannose dehydrogenase family protein [Arenicellales bacterium]|jgi:UDPglucose 6-dehydrogenase|nr:UDP-glucose/GDP-mannose dehydrogenase family protein [Arenicellales bacterium]